MEMNQRKDLVFDSIIRDLGEGILTLGLDGQIGMINPAAESLLGVSREEIQGKKFSRIFF